MKKIYPRSGLPSGCVQTWSFWRHCCCRFGWYPVLVAPIVTTGLLLDLYSSLGCQFIELDVGFTPSNSAWNESTAELGLFYFNNDGDPFEGGNALRETFAEGCNAYPSDFEDFFIDGDKTWTAARIMAYISGSAGTLATVTAWLTVVSSLPAKFFWPGVLLPSVMVAFLAQGSKFLFFDTKICQGFVWFPFGENVTPRTANSCTLGKTGEFAIAAGAVYFLSLLLVCLKTPQTRQLQEDYGKRREEDEGVDALRAEGLDEFSDEENQYYTVIAPLPSAVVASSGSSGDEVFADEVSVQPSEDALFTKKGVEGSPESNASEPSAENDLSKEHISAYDYVPNEMEDENDQNGSIDNRDDVASVKSPKGVDVRLDSDTAPTVDSSSSPQKLPPNKEGEDDEDRGYLPYNTKATSSPSRISETRLSKKKNMEVSQPDEALIDKFVTEFEKSFVTDDESHAESISTIASF